MNLATTEGKVQLLKVRKFFGNCYFNFCNNYFYTRKVSLDVSIIKIRWYDFTWLILNLWYVKPLVQVFRKEGSETKVLLLNDDENVVR